jgi:alpha-ketoglutarate-dependent taurine dioxygenase
MSPRAAFPSTPAGSHQSDTRECRPYAEGGETRFASCTAAFESLPEEERKRFEASASTHSWAGLYKLNAVDP